MKIEDTCKKCN